jgi:hypothetical protein
VVPSSTLSKGDTENVYTAQSRVRPLPAARWGHFAISYRAAKVLALDATDRFLAEKSPRFSIVNIMPGYVVGPNELVTDADQVASGSNELVMSMVLGVKGCRQQGLLT